MLQYMKETRIDNPNILVKDKRILELNDIVTEVKESEEWKAVTMNFMELCMTRGMEQGMEKGEYYKLLSLIRKKHSKGCSAAVIADALEEPEEYIIKILDLLNTYPEWTNDQIIEQLK